MERPMALDANFRLALVVYAGVFFLTLHALNAPESPLTPSALGLLAMLGGLILAPTLWRAWQAAQRERTRPSLTRDGESFPSV